jgi:hypothetical protein
MQSAMEHTAFRRNFTWLSLLVISLLISFMKASWRFNRSSKTTTRDWRTSTLTYGIGGVTLAFFKFKNHFILSGDGVFFELKKLELELLKSLSVVGELYILLSELKYAKDGGIYNYFCVTHRKHQINFTWLPFFSKSTSRVI